MVEKEQFTVTFLGTGTSQGIPVISCDCTVCISADVRDKRMRSSVLLQSKNRNIVIDTSPDFRYQMLKHNVKKMDAILLTHEHNDHTIGLDDIRPFNFRQQYEMPVYGLQRVLDDVKTRFRYIFEEHKYPGCPSVKCHSIEPGVSFELLDEITCTPVEVMHGNLPVLGFRFGNFAYITDASQINENTMKSLEGLGVLVLNALQHKPHYSHFNFVEALAVIEKLKPVKAYLTHISHNLGLYRDLIRLCPSNVYPAYDGLVIHV